MKIRPGDTVLFIGAGRPHTEGAPALVIGTGGPRPDRVGLHLRIGTREVLDVIHVGDWVADGSPPAAHRWDYLPAADGAPA